MQLDENVHSRRMEAACQMDRLLHPFSRSSPLDRTDLTCTSRKEFSSACVQVGRTGLGWLQVNSSAIWVFCRELLRRSLSKGEIAFSVCISSISASFSLYCNAVWRFQIITQFIFYIFFRCVQQIMSADGARLGRVRHQPSAFGHMYQVGFSELISADLMFAE